MTQLTIPLHRATDPDTSREAGEKVKPHRTRLQNEILGALVALGPMTAKEMERLPQFARCAPSTVRKRVSELSERGDLVAVGKRDGATVWRVG